MTELEKVLGPLWRVAHFMGFSLRNPYSSPSAEGRITSSIKMQVLNKFRQMRGIIVVLGILTHIVAMSRFVALQYAEDGYKWSLSNAYKVPSVVNAICVLACVGLVTSRRKEFADFLNSCYTMERKLNKYQCGAVCSFARKAYLFQLVAFMSPFVGIYLFFDPEKHPNIFPREKFGSIEMIQNTTLLLLRMGIVSIFTTLGLLDTFGMIISRYTTNQIKAFAMLIEHHFETRQLCFVSPGVSADEKDEIVSSREDKLGGQGLRQIWRLNDELLRLNIEFNRLFGPIILLQYGSSLMSVMIFAIISLRGVTNSQLPVGVLYMTLWSLLVRNVPLTQIFAQVFEERRTPLRVFMRYISRKWPVGCEGEVAEGLLSSLIFTRMEISAWKTFTLTNTTNLSIFSLLLSYVVLQIGNCSSSKFVAGFRNSTNATVFA